MDGMVVIFKSMLLLSFAYLMAYLMVWLYKYLTNM